jgi:hypothetical protein
LLPHELAVEFRRATGSGLDLVQKFPQVHFSHPPWGRRSELCSKLLSVALMKDSVNFANRRHDHAWSTVKGSRSPPWPFVASRAHTVLASVRPAVWDRTTRVGACNCRPGARRSPRRQVASWQCGSAGRGCLRVGKWCDIGRGQRHQYLKRRDGHHKKRFLGVFGAAADISNAPIR